MVSCLCRICRRPFFMKAGVDSSLHPRYLLHERIGKGGMGEVFRSYDRLTGQTVALKRVLLSLPAAAPAPAAAGAGMTSLGQAATVAPEALPSGQSLDSELASSALTAAGAFVAAHSAQLHTLRVHLTQEFRTLAGLRHPHIVSVLDYGFDRDHQPYFTMEYLERAEPLDKAAREQPFSVKVNLLLQVLQALSYLHRRGVLHRDLKPGEVASERERTRHRSVSTEKCLQPDEDERGTMFG